MKDFTALAVLAIVLLHIVKRVIRWWWPGAERIRLTRRPGGHQ